MSGYDIAVLGGDGIGPEVVAEAVRVLEAAGGPRLRYREHPCGAGCFLERGTPLPEETVAACRQADAVLLGAMGLPHVRWPDGTEMRPQIDLRFRLDTYAGVRPIYLYAAHHTPLKGYRAGDIDLVILRENVEGLFASMNGGIQLRGETAVDSMVITRTGTERIARYAFELARDRLAERRAGGQRPAFAARPACGGCPPARPAQVICVDKANVFRSMAFFRRVFDEVAEAAGPEVAADHAYVDAMALHLVRRPGDFDVLVMENMYGDILSEVAVRSVLAEEGTGTPDIGGSLTTAELGRAIAAAAAD